METSTRGRGIGKIKWSPKKPVRFGLQQAQSLRPAVDNCKHSCVVENKDREEVQEEVARQNERQDILRPAYLPSGCALGTQVV